MSELAGAIQSFSRQLLGPVVSILLRSGIIYREFADIAKSVYVDVATREFGVRGRPTNVSRVAMMTGLTRREVSRQRDLLNSREDATSDRVHSTARVLMGWYTDPEFLDEEGKPLELDTEGELSFATLYQRHSGSNVPLTTMLKELLAVSAVEQTESGRLRVLSRFFRPAASDPHAIDRAGSVLEDLAQTVRQNIYRSAGEPTRFEGRAWSAKIEQKKAAEFREFLEARGQQFLEEIDSWLVAHEVGDGEGERIRLGVGVYEIRSQAQVASGLVDTQTSHITDLVEQQT